MKKTVLILIGISIFFTGCMYAIRYDGTYRGKVIDADTREPIEGVVVLGVWYVLRPGPAGGSHKFYDAKETVTDKNGEFEIKGQGLRILSLLEPVRVMIFKAGYSYLDGPWVGLKYIKKIKWEDDKAIIPLKKLTMEERKKQGSPPDPPDEAPMEKVIQILKEIDKDDIERGLEPRGIWRGERYE